MKTKPGAASVMIKFPELTPGQRFRWRGAVYRKSGPLTAHAEADGAAIMVPRSALVEPLDADAAASAPSPAGPRHPEAVGEALDALISRLGAVADEMAASDAERLRAALASARRSFVGRVGL